MLFTILNSSVRRLIVNSATRNSFASLSVVVCQLHFQQNQSCSKSCRNLCTGCKKLKEAENKPVKQDTEAPEETTANPDAQRSTGGFKWENRTRFATGIMVVWLAGVATYILKKRSERKDLHHSMMFSESLRYMSDEERNKILASMKPKS